ncbi:MAG TPA: helix-turn-helix domain-containing protein [Acidimicrobiales bacterium]|nr:helix-turn-helix domain-containing protein [Acidimicrobiales bacterium]
MAVEATRERILDAVHALLAEESPAALSIPAVAQRAGTSLRTVYRYFPTKEALVDAASRTFEPDLEAGGPVSTGNLSAYLTHTFTSFTKGIGPVRAQHVTPAGRELRNARLPRSRASSREALVAAGCGSLPPEDLDDLVDVTVALIGSSMYLELVDRMGHDETDAARLAAWVAESIIDRARTEGRVAP